MWRDQKSALHQRDQANQGRIRLPAGNVVAFVVPRALILPHQISAASPGDGNSSVSVKGI
jgi:hypothetical protein